MYSDCLTFTLIKQLDPCLVSQEKILIHFFLFLLFLKRDLILVSLCAIQFHIKILFFKISQSENMFSRFSLISAKIQGKRSKESEIYIKYLNGMNQIGAK